MNRLRQILAATAALLLAGSALTAENHSEAKTAAGKPNIVLILANNNLCEDIGEQNDLTTSNPEIRERLRKVHDQWFNGLPAPFSNLTTEQIEERKTKARAHAAKRKEREAKKQP